MKVSHHCHILIHRAWGINNEVCKGMRAYAVCILMFPEKPSPTCNNLHWRSFVEILWETMEVTPYTTLPSRAKILLNKRPYCGH